MPAAFYIGWGSAWLLASVADGMWLSAGMAIVCLLYGWAKASHISRDQGRR